MTSQLNLKLPDKLFKAASDYAGTYGYRNIQELIYESMREKVFEKNEFDEGFTEKEIALIDDILEASIRKKRLAGEQELRTALSQ